MTSTPVGVNNTVTDDRALSFHGVDHVSLTVSNLNASEQFYTEVLGFMVVLDLGYGLVCMDKATGFTLGLIKHEDGTGGRFSHLSTGLDHLGLTAQTREELVAWEQKFRRLGVTFTPIRDKPLGYHLNSGTPTTSRSSSPRPPRCTRRFSCSCAPHVLRRGDSPGCHAAGTRRLRRRTFTALNRWIGVMAQDRWSRLFERLSLGSSHRQRLPFAWYASHLNPAGRLLGAQRQPKEREDNKDR